ncbi:MAG: dephospho-CoA kinase [Chloroflexota bacterium]|nr:dephospho-CoA kinase [Chloroflexota bacterium]
MKNFYLIGLTGNLGSGKSTVRRMLEQLGARGIDADALAHVAMQRGTPTWRAVVDAFGENILAFNGRIDRRKLGARVFDDADALQKLESIVHPAVGTLTQQLLREANDPVVVVEAIKLIEAGMHLWCDAVWVVRCAPEAALERVRRDRQMSEADARARLAAQTPVDEKVRTANVVIDNSGDENTTRAQVERAWRAIRRETARDKSAWLFATAPLATPPAVAQPGLRDQSSPAAPDWASGGGSFRAAPISQPTQAIAPVPIWAKGESKVEVRRARRSDLDALAVTIAKIGNRAQPLSRADTLKRLGERGYRIAIADGRIVALAAWEAENLVATVREIWAEPGDTSPRAIPQLFALIEGEAKALQCEVVLLLIDENALTISAEALALGYEQQELQTLHSVWQVVATERLHAGDQVWVKRLRTEITTKPN